MSKKSFNKNSFNGFKLLLLILIILRFGTINNYYQSNNDGKPAGADEMDVFVQIEGDIKYPGVYSFQHDMDLKQLIIRSGGLNTKSIRPDAVNNIILESGEKVRISMDSGQPYISVQEMTAFQKLTLGIPISINRESEVGLTSLPGIGPVLAGAIVSEGMKKGGFKKVNELLGVHGMGERKFNKIAPYITE